MFDNRCMNFDNMNMDYGYSNMDYNYMNMDETKMPAMDNMVGSCCTLPGTVSAPIYECPRINYVTRTICHTVPHIIPCETRVINHHVYRHTYTPCYKMSEQSTCENVYDNPCC